MSFPSLNGNWIDFAILLFLLLYLLVRRGRGFIEGLIDFSGFILSFIIGLKYYPVAAKILMGNFSFPIGIANALGFLFLVFAVEFLSFFFLSFAITFLPEKVIKSKINKILGTIPELLSFLVITAFILTAIIIFPVRPDIKQSIINSRIGGLLTEKTLGLEKYMSNIFGGAIQESLAFLTVNPKGQETVNLHFKTSADTVDMASEQGMFILVNNERIKRGISPLSGDNSLITVARDHCFDMFARGYFSHYTPEGLSPFDRMKNSGIDYLV